LCLQALTATTAADPGVIRKASPYPPKQTIDRFEQIVEQKGMTIFARIDHKANANTVKMNMNEAELLIFGNPAIGTRIMNHDTAAGLDLPLRVLAYTDDDGNNWLIYHDPAALKTHFNVEHCTAIEKVSGAMDKLTDAAVAKK
jgi:uncharacterized protein (DUF302 family)